MNSLTLIVRFLAYAEAPPSGSRIIRNQATPHEAKLSYWAEDCLYSHLS